MQVLRESEEGGITNSNVPVQQREIEGERSWIGSGGGLGGFLGVERNAFLKWDNKCARHERKAYTKPQGSALPVHRRTHGECAKERALRILCDYTFWSLNTC